MSLLYYPIWTKICHYSDYETLQVILDMKLGDKRNHIIVTDFLIKKRQRLFIPLNFWFSRNENLAMPLIALSYRETKIEITLRDTTELLIPSYKYMELD